MEDITTNINTSGKSINLMSRRNDFNIETEIRNINIDSHKNLNLNSDIDSINIDAHHCVNINSTEKSINLYSENGMINLTSYDDTTVRSISGIVNINSDRKNVNINSFEDLELTSKQGDISMDSLNGDINITSLHDINITPGSESQVTIAGSIKAKKIIQGGSSPSDSGLLIPVGTIMAYCGTSSPSGWFICNGSEYDKIIYNDLYLVIGTTFGGSGNNFAVPDMRGRTMVGASYDLQNFTNKNVGDIGGSETHTLTTDEMPSHTHNVDADISGWSSSAYGVAGAPDRPDRGSNSITSTSTGGGNAHSIMQPYMTLNYIIKY